MLKLKLTLLASLISFISCSHNSYQLDKNHQFQLDIKKEVLENGLTLIMIKNEYLPLFSFYTFYKVGSKFERPGITGSAHFLEHLMFKGAKKYGPGAFENLIESNGGESNAYTTYDMTVYHENLPVKALATVVDLEADRMENLALEQDSFIKEKGVILEERKYRYENSPSGQMIQAILTHAYAKTPYQETVIGSIEDIKNVTRDEVHEFFKTFYAPDNAVIVISGDIDFEATAFLVKQKFAGIKKSATLQQQPRLSVGTAYEQRWPKGKEVKLHGNLENPLFSFVYRSLPVNSSDSQLIDLLAVLLGSGKSSYLNKNFVEKDQPLLNRVGASNYDLQHGGIFLVEGELIQTTNWENFKKEYAHLTKNLCHEAITEVTVERAKNIFLLDYVQELQTNAGLAEFIGSKEILYGDYTQYSRELEKIMEATKHELIRVCEGIFEQNPDVFVIRNR